MKADDIKKLNIYQRVNEVRKLVSYIEKDASVSGGGANYKAVTHDMVTAMLREHLITFGIVTRVQQTAAGLLQARGPNPKGKDDQYNMNLYAGDYVVHFVNIDNPQDSFPVEVNAHGTDSGDKAPGKAMSMAVKYALLKTFNIETGENEESRVGAKPYSQEQFELYHDYVESESAYQLFMFLSSLTTEAQVALHNSFPEGQIVKGKKKANELMDKGGVRFNEVVEEVQAGLANHDPAVLEITNEMVDHEKRMLQKRLSDFEIKTLSKLKKESEAAV